jgi:putative flavoprotein involved in K+ transport
VRSASPTAPPPSTTPCSGRPASTHDDSWIDIPDVTDKEGRIQQSRGITPSPGLYTLGLTWQHTRGSALLGWVGNDAAFLAQQIGAITP